MTTAAALAAGMSMLASPALAAESAEQEVITECREAGDEAAQEECFEEALRTERLKAIPAQDRERFRAAAEAADEATDEDVPGEDVPGEDVPGEDEPPVEVPPETEEPPVVTPPGGGSDEDEDECVPGLDPDDPLCLGEDPDPDPTPTPDPTPDPDPVDPVEPTDPGDGGNSGGGNSGGGNSGGGNSGGGNSGGGNNNGGGTANGNQQGTQAGTSPEGVTLQSQQQSVPQNSECTDSAICQTAPPPVVTTASADGLPDTGASEGGMLLGLFGGALVAGGAALVRPRRTTGRHLSS